MTPADKPKFLAALNELALLKHGTRLSTEAYDAWWNAMSPTWELDEFRGACTRLRDSVPYMPNPFHFAQLKRAAGETDGELWAAALAHARSLPVSGGYLMDKPSGHPMVDSAAHAVGGFRVIANANERDLQFIGKRFTEHLEAFREAWAVREVLPSLMPPELQSLLPGYGPRRIGKPS